MPARRDERGNMNGILNVRKEPGFTSFDVVAKLRGICKQKKIGHTGTLDPAASGVLPVCLGNATKLCGFLTEKTKQYRAVMRLGVETDTQDLTGIVLERRPAETDEAAVREAVRSFVGAYDQVPPMYSALKVNGQKLCDLARAGRVVERKSRPVTIYEIVIEEIALPCVTMTVTCSSGTYIRTLCHDIGRRLGCGGALESLVRTRSGQFVLEEAHTLSEIEDFAAAGRLGELLLPTDSVFSDLPAVSVRKEALKPAVNGNPLPPEAVEPAGGVPLLADAPGLAAGVDPLSADAPEPAGEGPSSAKTKPWVRVYAPDGLFLGIYCWEPERRRLKPVKMFLGKEG